MARGKPLHLRLFLEGQEVPVISAQVQATLFAPASAAIQVVPLDEVMNLKPRTMVHLFFLEEPEEEDDISGARGGRDGAVMDTELSDDIYKLLFCGEVVGFSFVKTPMSRAIVLQCLDHSSYWDFVYATMLDYGPQGNALVARSELYASNDALMLSLPGMRPEERLREWLLSQPQSEGLRDVTGLAGGILHLMEVLGGTLSFDNKSGAHKFGVNDFFTIAELRNHLLAQVTAEDNDSTSQKLLEHTVFFKWLSNSISSAGGHITLRDMFKLLCQYIYYTIVPNPVARYIPKDSAEVPVTPIAPGTPRKSSPSSTKYDQEIAFAAQANSVEFALLKALVKQESGFKHDVVSSAGAVGLTQLMPGTGARMGVSRANLTDPTANLMGGARYLRTMLNMFDNDYELALAAYNAGPQSVRRAGYRVPTIHYGGPNKGKPNTETPGYVKNIMQFYTQFKGDPQPKTWSSDVGTGIGRVETVSGYTDVGAGQKKTVSTPDKLYTQIFRPDCYMAPPPTCNVIFPEQYTQITYDRNFLNEVTRVEIDVHCELAYGSPAPRDPQKALLTSPRFLQPELQNIASEVARRPDNRWRILMSHELHTGIVPRQEWLPDTFTTDLFRDGKSEAKKGTKEEFIDWGRKTGLHHFFKYRIGPRTMSVAGRFMPYLVTGFPALVIQKPFYISAGGLSPETDPITFMLTTKNPAGPPLRAPPQFLGMIESITHSVGQDGGRTAVSMSHCRSHLGIDDEFVGAVLKAQGTDKKLKQLVNWSLTFDQAMKDERLRVLLADCTPQTPFTDPPSKTMTLRSTNQSDISYPVTQVAGGVSSTITKSVSVQSVSESTSSQSSNPLVKDAKSVYGPVGATVKVPASPGRTQVGSKGPKGGRIKDIHVLPPYSAHEVDGVRYYDAIFVFEEIEVPYDPSSDPALPVETVVKPSWLSAAYDNENVGPRVYAKFFGCGSITDELVGTVATEVPPSPPADGVFTPIDEQVQALEARVKGTTQARAVLSIEAAVNYIAYQYGQARLAGADIEAFIDALTRRPVASKGDVLGSFDLEINVDGSSANAAKGTPGFHSFSLDPVCVAAGNLTGLISDPTFRTTRMDDAERQVLTGSYDVRKAKFDQVKAYVDALTSGNRGFIG